MLPAGPAPQGPRSTSCRRPLTALRPWARAPGGMMFCGTGWGAPLRSSSPPPVVLSFPLA
eukprot:5797013-Alexandrium_andersonii.AAC.2